MTNRLKELRLAKGLTQEELAQEVGVTNFHIHRIEKGKVNTSVMLMAKIAKVLNCSIEEILMSETLTSESKEGENEGNNH